MHSIFLEKNLSNCIAEKLFEIGESKITWFAMSDTVCITGKGAEIITDCFRNYMEIFDET